MPFPFLSRLASAIRTFGLPPLCGIESMHTSGAVEHYRLRFAGSQSDLIFGRQLWNTGDSPFQRALAAHTALRLEDLWPVAGYRVFPHGAFDQPAALWVDGGGVGARAGAVPAEQVLTDLGRTWARIERVIVPHCGVRADAGQFRTVRGSWRADVAWLVQRELVGLERAGCADLPVVGLLAAMAEEGLPSVPAHPVPGLIHFGLRPCALRYHGRGPQAAIIGVDSWDQALAGDPLAGFAPMVGSLHPTELALVFAGAGEETVRELFDGEGFRRLPVYVALFALGRVRLAAEFVANRPSAQSTVGFYGSIALAGRCARPEYCQNTVTQALRGESPAAWPVLSTEGRLRGRALLMLGAGPVPGADRIPHLLSALSAVDLAHVADGDVSAHFLEHGHRFLDAAMVGPGVLRERAPTDRREWRKRLIEDSVRACADAGPALGLGLLAAALDALDEFGDALPGRCLSGLETWIRGQLQREAQRRQPGALGAQERVMYGLIGQDAARRLGAPELAGRWRHQASEALDVLQISAGLKDVPTTELAELLPLFRRELNFQQEGSLVYPALAAALRLSEADALTAEPAVVVRLCFDLLGKAL